MLSSSWEKFDVEIIFVSNPSFFAALAIPAVHVIPEGSCFVSSDNSLIECFSPKYSRAIWRVL